MLLRDGETTVIGGIYVDNDTSRMMESHSMDIPYLGNYSAQLKNKSKDRVADIYTRDTQGVW
jgi:hypothetical protein